MEPTSSPNPLRAARLAAGMSQQQLADRLGITQATISTWETGKVSPRVSDLTQVATALGVAPIALLAEAVA